MILAELSGVYDTVLNQNQVGIHVNLAKEYNNDIYKISVTDIACIQSALPLSLHLSLYLSSFLFHLVCLRLQCCRPSDILTIIFSSVERCMLLLLLLSSFPSFSYFVFPYCLEAGRTYFICATNRFVPVDFFSCCCVIGPGLANSKLFSKSHLQRK